ncbi:MAG: hypothetical protein ACI8Z5_002706 [Lentimonas sp.]|jgi:hypothetical protein
MIGKTKVGVRLSMTIRMNVELTSILPTLKRPLTVLVEYFQKTPSNRSYKYTRPPDFRLSRDCAIA